MTTITTRFSPSIPEREDAAMNTAILEQKETYREVNSVTGSVNSVMFGTASFSELPVAELVQDFGLNISVCNRSVEEATLKDAFDLLHECVFALNPSKVFLNFGETDLMRPDFDLEAFLDDYARLIGLIRSQSRSRVFVISVISERPEARKLNDGLRALCKRTGCRYVDVADVFSHEMPRLRLFSELTHYMREGKISFSDAMNFCEA